MPRAEASIPFAKFIRFHHLDIFAAGGKHGFGVIKVKGGAGVYHPISKEDYRDKSIKTEDHERDHLLDKDPKVTDRKLPQEIQGHQ